jgi:ribosomal protein L14E/L6E/L27E
MENIRDFNDIKLQTYDKKCTGNLAPLKEHVTLSVSDPLLIQYAEHVKQTIANAHKHQQDLIAIIDKIFVYVIDPQTHKKIVRIRPTLTESNLQELVVDTRRIISTIYLACELDYAKGVQMYEAIVLQKTLETAQKQTTRLKNEQDKLLIY